MQLKFDQQKIEELCRKHGLRLLILHGSCLKNTATDKSDIDVGILSRGKVDSDKHFAVIRDFGEIFGDKFDPVFLNGAESMISYHVALAGKPLFEEQRGDFSHFRVQALARYMDTKKFRDLEKVYIKRAIAKRSKE